MQRDILPFSNSTRTVISASAAERLTAARDFLRDCAGHVLIVGASRGAADDLARSLAAERVATFGIERLSLTQLAARTAIAALAADGVAPSTWLGTEAVAARAVFEARESGGLSYFAPVAGLPGFPRALARTMQELRLSAVDARALAALPLAGPDLQTLLDRVEQSFAAAGTADRAALLATAAAILESRPLDTAIVLLDVPVEHPADERLVHALLKGASAVLATVPDGDVATLHALERMGAAVERRDAPGETSLDRLQRYLFDAAESPPERDLDTTVELFSAPGEGRECVEIARRVLGEASRGVRFDEMAIFVRSPHSYFGLLEHALGRAGIPGWFDRGTRRPHPAGRAFLAILACAAEQLSAARFAEYLSLGQVPSGAAWSACPERSHGEDPAYTRPSGTDASEGQAESRDEVFGRDDDRLDDEGEREAEEADAEAAAQTPADPVVAGTLRAPWKWERLLAEAAVIGQDAGRWRRRLDGAAAAMDRQIREAERQGGTEDDGRVRGLKQAREQLDYLRAFALPLMETMAAWPARARWGEWLDLFDALVPRVLRAPDRVRRVLADLRPMASVGPVDLDEARRVLGDRLLMLESEPPSRRFGRVFVGPPHQARGRSFRVVFVPGLAERLFPQKPREDPLLLDALRAQLGAPLPRQGERLRDERLLLQLAAGAARDRLYVSYPRIELSESRPRVPSFYALDIMRAATGRIPHHEQLEDRARQAGLATLAWPAPPDPAAAIDDQEHDLAMLRQLLDRDRGHVRGHAHYLLKLNEALRRSVINRWARGKRQWSASDGLIRVTPATAEALARQRLTERPYSLSALQKFSSCPYQFVLAAIYRLQPLESPEPIQRLDPLTRGSIFHEIQARFFGRLEKDRALPVTAATLADARGVLDGAIDSVARAQHEALAPAVERVWADEIASIARDLHAWLEHVAADGAEWTPKYFELAFGKVPGERDPHSRPDAVRIGPGYQLRGAIDLIEEHAPTKALRVTDHKTGRRPDKVENVIVGGGGVLQPVVYGMLVEEALGQTVYVSRLSYCTAAGGFSTHEVPITDRTRRAALEVLEIIDRAVESGFLAAAPTEEACGRCDFRSVCGPGVFRRVAWKPQDRLADLHSLRVKP